MTFRWTKRPLNVCNSCGYTWYPRGSDLSRCCPNCGSADVVISPIYLIGLVAGVIVLGVVGFVACLSTLIGPHHPHQDPPAFKETRSRQAPAAFREDHGPDLPNLAIEQDRRFRQYAAEAEKHLHNDNVPSAFRAARVALDIRDDARVRKLLTIAEQATSATNQLTQTQKALTAAITDDAVKQLRAVADFVATDLQETPFDRIKTRLRRDLARLQKELFDQAIKRARRENDLAKDAQKTKNYAEAVVRATKANNQYVLALRASDLGDNKLMNHAEQRRIDADIAALQLVISEGKARVALENGKDHLKRGSDALLRPGLRNLKAARSEFESAKTHLLDAASFGDTKAESEAGLEKAVAEMKVIAQLIQPIDVDFMRETELLGWHNDGWATTTDDKNRWLQAVKPRQATLKSPDILFPTDFAMQVDIGVVSQNKQLNNEYWSFFPDLLTVSLITDNGDAKNITVTLGKNPKLILERFAHVAINGKGHGASHIAKAKGLVSLRMTRAKQQLAVIVNDIETAVIPCTLSFTKITITANQGTNSGMAVCFPIISRIALTMQDGE